MKASFNFLSVSSTVLCMGNIFVTRSQFIPEEDLFHTLQFIALLSIICPLFVLDSSEIAHYLAARTRNGST
ncbi:hypothetical protein Y032_0228g2853 [Ancylostoma ceylanicum]|nr:hypothetical protein Y032_0228g2853 [Ancylostoma ceylanicum]